MSDRTELERQLAELPLYQYEFLKTDELTFTERVRDICRSECPMYNRSWACPPAVGTVEVCRARCMRFDSVLAAATICEVSDIANLEETLATRAPHEAVTREALAILKPHVKDVMALSTEACAICKTCAWPDAPCRHPDKMYPCVESHGILVTALADRLGMSFFNGNLVTWYSLIFYNDPSASAENSVHG